MTEQTLVLLKPDTLQRNIVGEVLTYFEKGGLEIANIRWVQLAPVCLLDMHYKEHKGKPFLPGLIMFMRSGPIIAVAIEGEDAVRRVRSIVGDAKPQNAGLGTIRYELAWGRLRQDVPKNLVHASDSPAAAARELAIWFAEGYDIIE